VQVGIALKPIPLSIAAMPEREMTENEYLAVISAVTPSPDIHIQ
jgi:hypothetical protein